jgi:hypothetical protein
LNGYLNLSKLCCLAKIIIYQLSITIFFANLINYGMNIRAWQYSPFTHHCQRRLRAARYPAIGAPSVPRLRLSLQAIQHPAQMLGDTAVTLG